MFVQENQIEFGKNGDSLWYLNQDLSPLSLPPTPWYRHTTDWCSQEEVSLSSHLPVGGLSLQEGQNTIISHSTPSYLLLKLNSRQVWLTGTPFFHPNPIPETWALAWLGHDEITGDQITLDTAHLRCIRQGFQARRGKPSKPEAIVASCY